MTTWVLLLWLVATPAQPDEVVAVSMTGENQCRSYAQVLSAAFPERVRQARCVPLVDLFGGVTR